MHPKHKALQKSNYHLQYKHYPKSITHLTSNPYPKPRVGLKCKLPWELHRKRNSYKLTPHPQTNLHQKLRNHPKCISSLYKHIRYLNTTKKNKSHITRHLNLNMKPNPKTHSKHNTHPQPYSKHKYHVKHNSQQSQYTQQHNKKVSAYRPRHKEKPTYLKLEKLASKTIIKHPSTNKSTHPYLAQQRKTTTLLTRFTTKAIISTPKIYIRINTIIHNKIQYISQHTPHHIKHTHNLLQRYPVHSQYKYHLILKPHTKQTRYLKPTSRLKYEIHPNYDSHLRHKCPVKLFSHPKPKLHSKLNNHPQYKFYTKTKQCTQGNHPNLKQYQINNIHPKHNPHLHPKCLDSSEPKLHLNYKRYSKNKKALAHWPRHKTNCIHNLTQNLKHHPNSRDHPKLNYLSKLNPQSKHIYHLKHTTASVYRPRHTNNNIYHLIRNWKHNSATNHITTNNTQMNFSPKQVEKPIPAIPNLFTTTKFTIVIYLKINKKKPKILHSNGYYFINKIELLKCGDIELNPGPMPNILRTHPATHKK